MSAHTNTCSKCGLEKPLSEFGSDNRLKRGYRAACLMCSRRSKNAHNASDPDKHRREVSRWKKANPKKRHAQDKRYRHVNKDKVLAHWAVREAVKAGVLVKPETCDSCGKAVEGKYLAGHHHKGYDEVNHLTVLWLCDPCHKAAHRAILRDVEGDKS